MDYRMLGRSGLKVSALSLGTAGFGGSSQTWGVVDGAAAERQVAMALEAGVNLFDTANVYGDGHSEEVLGEVLAKQGRRQHAVVATKARFPMGEGPNDKGSSRAHLIAQCELSLKKLGTDWIDLYQLHEWDGLTPVEETMAALDRLVQDGKVRYVGVSNFSGWHIMKALGVSSLHNYPRFVSQQIHYTLFSREAEFELQPIAVDQGLGMLIWSPLAGGLLTGKYRREGGPEGTRHTIGFPEPPVYDRERLFDIVDVIVAIAEELGVSGAQVTLAWVLQRQAVSSVIIGGRTEAQIADNLKAADLRLSAEQIARLDKVSQLDLIYPYWHQSFTASDRLGEADLVLHRPYLKK